MSSTTRAAKCVFVDTDEENGFTLTASMIEPYLTDDTRMVIINSPSNPSGGILDREEFEQIFAMTSRARDLAYHRRVLLPVSV